MLRTYTLEDVLEGRTLETLSTLDDKRDLQRARDAAQRQHDWTAAAEANVLLGRHYEAGANYRKLGELTKALDCFIEGSNKRDWRSTKVALKMLLFGRKNSDAKRLFLRNIPEELRFLKLLADKRISFSPKEYKIIAKAHWKEGHHYGDKPSPEEIGAYVLVTCARDGLQNHGMRILHQSEVSLADTYVKLYGDYVFSDYETSDLVEVFGPKEVARAYAAKVFGLFPSRIDDEPITNVGIQTIRRRAGALIKEKMEIEGLGDFFSTYSGEGCKFDDERSDREYGYINRDDFVDLVNKKMSEYFAETYSTN